MRRHISAIVSVALTTAFVAAMVLGVTLLRESAAGDAETQLLGADLVATADGPKKTGESTEPPKIEGAETVWPILDSAFISVRAEDGTRVRSLRVYTPPPADVAETPLVAGRMAQDADELVVEQTAADQLGVEVGDSVVINRQVEEAKSGAVTLEVVGVTAALDSALVTTGPARIIVTDQNAPTLFGAELSALATTWHASLPEDADADQIAQADSTEKFAVDTVAQERAEREQSASGGFRAFGPVVAAFIVISLLTSVLVVSNTFSVIYTQRTRELALLRAIGATRRQVAGVMARESLLVSLIGSAIGVVLGHVVVQGALLVAPRMEWTPRVATAPVGILSVVLPLVAGVVITACAGIFPLRRAMRVAPLEAMRGSASPDGGTGWVRGLLATIGVLVGGGLIGAGVVESVRGDVSMGIMLGLAGGAISLLGVLVAVRILVGALMSLLSVILRRSRRVPARVAVANMRRHTGRSAATAAALLIGTTLMSMMAVGAQTADVSISRALQDRVPVDAVIRSADISSDAVAKVAATPGIAQVEPVGVGEIDVGASDALTVYGPQTAQLERTAVDPDLASTVTDGALVIGEDRAQSTGLRDGQVVQVPRSDEGSVDLTVRIDGNLKLTLVSAQTFEDLFGDVPVDSLFVAFAKPGSPERSQTDVFTIVGELNGTISDAVPDARMDAEGAQREVAQGVITVMLGTTLGLLAVAVVVSLVGVANTLTLGVMERTGENALLRALGTTRGQMRRMLIWEGLLLSAIGALLGVGLGVAYGVLGAMAVLGSQFPIVVSMPYGQLAGVVVVTVLAGVLASVLPGRRAARTPPARAVADARE